MKTAIRRSLLALSLCSLALLPSGASAQDVFEAAATPRVECADSAVPAEAQSSSSFTFEGCWSYFPAGTCYDIYRDSTGGYWICRPCGQTTKPGSGQCSQIGIQTLNVGWWCS